MQIVAVPLAHDAALASHFASLLERLGPFGPSPHLAIALSGGADSLALALLADQWARAQGGRITALTVDHGLRTESAQEALTVQRQILCLNITHQILTPEHTLVSNNLQEAARRWRYEALAHWCRTNNVLHCLVAHHAGDQRETIGLHQARGETADGTSGMSAIRPYQGVRFLRPLLTTEKETLTDYLQQNAISWIEDPSNTNPDFARVRLRQTLVEDAALRKTLAALAAQEGHARAQRDDTLARCAAEIVTLHPAGFADFSQDAWRQLPAPLASQLLADLLTTISGIPHRPRRAESERLAHAVAHNFTRRTLHGCEISLHRGIIRIAREFARCAPPMILSGSGTADWDQRFRLTYSLPENATITLASLGSFPKALRLKGSWPRATPAFASLDRPLFLPYIEDSLASLPEGARLTIGFAPAKPLAAAPFWWLN